MDISANDIKQLGSLARLELTGQEVESLHVQLPTIVKYVSQLQQVETTDVASLNSAIPVLRIDECAPSPAAAAILSQAPERSDRYWKVSAVFT